MTDIKKDRVEVGELANKTEIDFRPIRDNFQTDTVFSALIAHNASGNSTKNSSRYLAEAYKNYDDNLDNSILMIKFNEAQSKYFLKKYDIKYKEDFLYKLRRTDPFPVAPYPDMRKKYFTFNSDDEKAIELYNKLMTVRFRDRGTIVSKIVFQYVLRGKDEVYMDWNAKRIMQSLANMYHENGEEITEMLQDIIDAIWIFAEDNK